MLLCGELTINGTSDNVTGSTIIVNGAVADSTTDFSSGTFGGDSTTNLLMNTAAVSYNWQPSKYYRGNLIIASPFVNNHTEYNKCGNLTIATGGTLDGNTIASDLYIYGDFNVGGGLIGKSAYSSNGDADNYGTGGSAGLSSTGGPWTVEGWIRCADYSSAEQQWAGMDELQLYITSSGQPRVRSGGVSSSATNPDGSIAQPFTDGSWHHVAVVYDSGETNKRRMWVDGKELILSSPTATVTLGSVDEYYIGRHYDNTSYNLDGEIGYLRIWDEARTETEIRANMFKRTPTDSNSKCKINLLFDEGDGNVTVDNTGLAGADGDGTLEFDSLWAGHGAFTRGDSTLHMIGEDKQFSVVDALNVYNVTTTDTGETNFYEPFGYAELGIHGTLTQGDGTIDWDCAGKWHGSATVSSGIDLTEGSRYNYWATTANLPASSWYRLVFNVDTSLDGNLTTNHDTYCTTNRTLTANGYDLSLNRLKFQSGGGLALGNSTLTFTSTTGLYLSYDSGTFTAGPGATISGTTADTVFYSQNDWKVVGKCENLDVTNEELRVTGQVINCTGYIIQQHPSIDANQQLDYDTADDRDIQFGVPDLDKNTELVT